MFQQITRTHFFNSKTIVKNHTKMYCKNNTSALFKITTLFITENELELVSGMFPIFKIKWKEKIGIYTHTLLRS